MNTIKQNMNMWDFAMNVNQTIETSIMDHEQVYP